MPVLGFSFRLAKVRKGWEVDDDCNNGYKGRAGIYQVMPVSEEIGRIIMAEGNAMQIAEQAAKEGVWDLRRSALEKVKQGITSLTEANRVTID